MTCRTKQEQDSPLVCAIGVCWVLLLLGNIPFFTVSEGWALEPKEVLVVANRNAAKSAGLADYYIKRRGIPKQNLVLVWTTDSENCSRETYNGKIVAPIRRFLKEHENGRNIRCIVVMYGVPLRVAGPEIAQKEKAQDGRNRTLEFQQNEGASLDSEIALVLAAAYPLAGWVPNPFYLGRPKEPLPVEKEEVLMVSRLDGPSDEIVRRRIDDGLAAEAEGLSGVAYMDARWPVPGSDTPVEGYRFYDRSLHRTANLIQKNKVMPTVIEASETLFQSGQCPNAALYCGWYSLGRYVDAFKWMQGAIGYHIASSECATLRGKESQVWCKRMIEEGVVATVGPVDEPYVQAFPIPEIFFGFLTEGLLSLAECYFVSLPYLSWKMVLVGDPLYRPFKNRHLNGHLGAGAGPRSIGGVTVRREIDAIRQWSGKTDFVGE